MELEEELRDWRQRNQACLGRQINFLSHVFNTFELLEFPAYILIDSSIPLPDSQSR